MRISRLVLVPLLAALIGPTTASAQLNINVAFGTRLGPEIGIHAYATDRMGDWHNSYRRWTPVTLYDVNGRYYRTQVRGSRPVLVYFYQNEYFFPPQDQGFRGLDARYNYRRGPNDSDYGRARPWERDQVDVRLGTEIGVLGYSSDRAGDWRRNYRNWTPVVLYEVNGRYYPNKVGNARPVSMYRYKSEYFLPPDDDQFQGKDKRFDYNNKPNGDDRGRVRGRP